MAQTSEMPKGVHGDIGVEAVGEALLKHYKVGITNPWYEIGRSEQETYNRRRLPWSGNNYSVNTDNETVTGPNMDQVPSNIQDQWIEMAKAAENNLEGERFKNLEALHQQGLEDVGDVLEKDNAHQEKTVTNADGDEVEEEIYLRPSERNGGD